MRADLVERLEELSPRARRAVALMLVAVVAVGAVSTYYLHPWTALKIASSTTSPAPLASDRPERYALYSFVSQALGWTVVVSAESDDPHGSYWLFKTVDAGRHWQRQLSGKTAVTYATASSLRFLDARTGFVAAGDPLSLYRTRDGGDHWTRADLPSPVQFVQFLDTTTGFAVARTEGDVPPDVFVTGDGGGTWTRSPKLPADAGFWPQFRNREEWWGGVGSDQGPPHVLLTLDGGVTWSTRALPQQSEAGPFSTWVDIVPNAKTVVAYVGTEGGEPHIYSSDDGGGSWAALKLPSSATQLAYLDATHWWASAGSLLFKSADAGRSWTRVAGTPPNLYLVQLMDERHAWGLIDDGHRATLVFTSDGGRHWTPTNVPSTT
jgi:photosystem II stability/assembly factor-like uncharacterized protein